jgi:hypothetical protein|tara:strand:+ start:4537 stop:5766 length:1230 start_codon:yes stop_codon:yes gene_type:complete
MDSKKTLLSINRLLLTNLLKFAGLSQSQCSLTLSHHRNSLVGYIYRYDKKIFPRSFSYFFLLSIYRALAKKHNPKEKISRFDLFYNMISKNGGVIEKLLIPALEHHILAISSLNPGIKIGSGENISINKNDIFDQDELTILDKYIEKIEPEKYEDYIGFLQGYENTEDWLQNMIGEDFEAIDEIKETYTDEYKNFELEIKAIKDFYIICESLRKIFLPNFFSPSDYKKINFINSKSDGFLMKKSAIRKNFSISDFSKLFLVKVEDDYMSPAISIDDECLAIKTTLGETNAFKGGLFVVKEFNKICIRRLQFTMFKDTYQIISIPDNNKYSRQTIAALDNKGKPRKDYIIGKVIWKSGFTNENNTIMDKNLFEQDFEIPEFLSRGLKSEPNLFSDEINEIPNEDIKKKRA